MRTRFPTAKGGAGLRGRGASADAGGLAPVVDPAATVDLVISARDREAVELAPPHPARTTAIATPNAATPRLRDLDGDAVGSGIGLR